MATNFQQTRETSTDEANENDSFFEAILENDIEHVKLKIASGLTGLSKNSFGDMALHFACLNSKLDILRLLKETLQEGEINTINVEKDDSICGTALHMSMDGQVDTRVVELLLQWGANANATDAKGSPVLHELIYRAWEGFEAEFAWEFDNNQDRALALADDASNSSGCESEAHVSGRGYIKKLKLLKKHGADMNCIHSETSMSALHFWCQSFHWSIEDYTKVEIPKWCYDFLETLLRYGANPNIENRRGDTAVYYMAQRHYKPCDDIFMNSYRNLLSLLLPLIDNVAAKNIYGRTLLHDAAEMSNYILFAQLNKMHLDVNIKDNFGLTPLHIITHNITEDENQFVLDIIRELMQHGGTVDSQDNYGSTPLHHAIYMKNHAAAKCLLSQGASTSITDNCERNACDLVKIEGTELIQELFGLVSEPMSEHNSQQSNVRYGRYFPLCCTKNTSPDKDKDLSEKSEIVNDSKIDEWLETRPMCIHNRRVVLQTADSSLEPNQSEYTNRDYISMKKEIYKLAVSAAKIMGELNPAFKCKVIFGGSVSEETKVGGCDEFDLVFDLFELGQHVEVMEESGIKPGFVKLKVTDIETLSKYDSSDLVNEQGCLMRLPTSNKFHKLLEKALASKEVWHKTSYFSFWGSTNSFGEAFNIGQMRLLWFGPFEKRRTIDVDIVPVIRLEAWHSKYCEQNIHIAKQDVVESTGCYAVMKDTNIYFEVPDKDTESNADYTNEDTLFKISVSQIEHAVMRHLPRVIKCGYKIAKSIPLQCPILALKEDFQETQQEPQRDDIYLLDENQSLRRLVNFKDYITSFVIKTGLFHELDKSGVCLDFGFDDVAVEHWNRYVLDQEVHKEKPTKVEIVQSLQWSLRIYRRILVIIKEQKRLPEYFIPASDATRVRGGNQEFVDVISTFLKVVIKLLEAFEIPEL